MPVSTIAGSLGLAVVILIQLGSPKQEYRECTPEKKIQLYNECLAASEGTPQNPERALKSGEQYLACTSGPADDPDTLAKTNLAVARILISKGNNDGAIGFLISAISLNSAVKRTSQVYADLAHAYENGPYARLADDYRSRFQGKDDSPEVRLALSKLYPYIDNIIDAYARAVALAGIEVPAKSPKTGISPRSGDRPEYWMEDQVALYTFRKKGAISDLRGYIHKVLSTPLPPNPGVVSERH